MGLNIKIKRVNKTVYESELMLWIDVFLWWWAHGRADESPDHESKD